MPIFSTDGVLVVSLGMKFEVPSRKAVDTYS